MKFDVWNMWRDVVVSKLEKQMRMPKSTWINKFQTWNWIYTYGDMSINYLIYSYEICLRQNLRETLRNSQTIVITCLRWSNCVPSRAHNIISLSLFVWFKSWLPNHRKLVWKILLFVYSFLALLLALFHSHSRI